MSVWKKTLLYLGLVEEDDMDGQIDIIEEAPVAQAPSTIRKISREELSNIHQIQTGPQPLGQVHIVAPAVYDDAKEIGDKLKSGVPVIMNLQGVEDDTFKRLTAFASGLAYGLGGDVQRLAPRMYLITPANVEVSAEERQRLKRGLFNEF
ncbi:MAG TPA: cell division protein SepF [Actinomycetota bacterium]|jgi:cell division inhibitor SepF|nr:cell division protein SepF [Actinomycetota bacterium]